LTHQHDRPVEGAALRHERPAPGAFGANCGMSLLLCPATVPEQKLLRTTFFLLRLHDSPHDTGRGGNHENDPDDHVKWSISAVAPTVHHPL